MKNYYEILEVNPKASYDIIKKVYKIKIKQNHPDLFQGDEKLKAEEITKELTEAYNVLSNESLRDKYDSSLEETNEKIEQLMHMNNIYKEENELLKKELEKRNNLISTYLNAVNFDNYSPEMLNNLSNFNKKNKNVDSEVPFYKYSLNTMKDIFFKIIFIIIFAIFCILLISVITNTNVFPIVFNSLFK